MSQISNSYEFECLISRVLNEIIAFRSSVEHHFKDSSMLQEIGADIDRRLENLFANVQYELKNFQTQMEIDGATDHHREKIDQENIELLMKMQALSSKVSLHIAAMSQKSPQK